MRHSSDAWPWYIAILETSKTMFPGTYFGFDICNPKLFTSKNRSSIVPSLQNLHFTYSLMILRSKACHIRKDIENQFWPVLSYVNKCAEQFFKVCFAWNLLKSCIFKDLCFFTSSLTVVHNFRVLVGFKESRVVPTILARAVPAATAWIHFSY